MPPSPPDTSSESTPLQERLIRLIQTNGPISIADYMADALGHPHEGYYASQQAIGADGDFTTAPEISQLFGELIGLWLVQSWIEMGSPPRFNLVELGPGRGVLMADILHAAKIRPEFAKAAQLWLVEKSGRLRHLQKRRLDPLQDITPQFADEFADIPDGPCLIIANEFFDCLPIRQYVFGESGWRERLITYDEGEEALRFCESQQPPLAGLELEASQPPDPGAIAEICEDGATLMNAIAERVAQFGGRALIIDYGKFETAYGDTLQAVRDHHYWPVLSAPGRADVTAHVDFQALMKTAMSSGAGVYGPITQGDLLERLGMALRLERLCDGKPPAEQAKLHQGAQRIASRREMGEIFKAICVTNTDLPTPSGFG